MLKLGMCLRALLNPSQSFPGRKRQNLYKHGRKKQNILSILFSARHGNEKQINSKLARDEHLDSDFISLHIWLIMRLDLLQAMTRCMGLY